MDFADRAGRPSREDGAARRVDGRHRSDDDCREPDLPGNVCAAIEECGFASVWDQFADNAVSMYHLPQRWMAMPALASMSLFSRRKAGYGFRQASSIGTARACHRADAVHPRHG